MNRWINIFKQILLIFYIFWLPTYLFGWCTINGISITTAAEHQIGSHLVSDGKGGAVITWNDAGRGISAQRISSTGSLLWRVNGIAISTSQFIRMVQDEPDIALDNEGGAIIVWPILNGISYMDIYAQRVNSEGSTLWTSNGLVICNESNNQYLPKIAIDDNGGAIIIWMDYRRGYVDVYAQRINGQGTTLWTKGGVPVSITNNYVIAEESPQIISDGEHGAIIVWSANSPIFLQKVNQFGETPWSTVGIQISTTAWLTSHNYNPNLISDGNKGVYITWWDYRSISNGNPDQGTDIYVQHVNSNGSTLWINNGIAICTANNHQFYPQIVSDEMGGAIITWLDTRNFANDSNQHIYSQHISSQGSTLWALDGIAINTSMYNKRYQLWIFLNLSSITN